MNKFRLLKADEIECRVASISEKGLSLLLYKTARTDANLLDETVGSENWENDFKVVDGVLYGGIGIYDDQMGRQIWKWDAGTESNTEAEKGRASDAFKRAGFKFGMENCEIQKNDRGKLYCNDRFSVSEIGYNEKQEINHLIITNDKRGVDVYTFPKQRGTVIKYGEAKNTNDPLVDEKHPQEGPDGYYYCMECNNVIANVKISGKSYMPNEIATRALKKHGIQLCWACQKKREMQNS